MILLQLSAGQGPDECARAVSLALKTLSKLCIKENVDIEILETVNAKRYGCIKSVLVQLNGDKAFFIANQWNGEMQWICTSPFRPKHKRKNWFFSGQLFEINEQNSSDDIRFQTCRASGAGGQHVNTTDSAVQAVHVASGISVRVEAARSQHANKRLAKLLIMQKLAALQSEKLTQQDKQRWAQHHSLQRGDPVKVFKGMDFIQQM